MSNQRTDTAQEWTVEKKDPGDRPMKRITDGHKTIIGWTMRPFSESFQKISDAHNAAIKQYENLQGQGWFHPDIVNELRSQLDLWKRQCAFESEHREKYRNQIQPLVDVLEESSRLFRRTATESEEIQMANKIDAALAKLKEKPREQRGLDGKMYPVDPMAVKLAEDEQVPYSEALQRISSQKLDQ